MKAASHTNGVILYMQNLLRYFLCGNCEYSVDDCEYDAQYRKYRNADSKTKRDRDSSEFVVGPATKKHV
jgi:hypothetical protein